MKLSDFAIKFYSKLNENTIDSLKGKFPENKSHYVKSIKIYFLIIFICGMI